MSEVLKQFTATITCNLLAVTYGSVCAWASANYLTLTTDKTPLPSGPLTTSEISLVTSIPCFGAIIATLIYSLTIDRFSRKLLLVSIAVPQILSWVITLLALNPYHLYAARFISGVAGGAALVVIPVFVSEIAEDKVRGTLASMLILFCNAGVLFGFVIPIYFNYLNQIRLNIMLPTLFLVLVNFFPETPEYLLKRNQKILAEKSTNFYRGIKINPRSYEMKEVHEKEKKYEKIVNENTSVSLSDLCTPAAKKAIKIALIIGSLNQFCGAFSMLNYANKIFEDAGSTLSSDKAAIIVAVVQLTANFLAMALVDRAGRKLLMTVSAFGTSFGLICMGLYDLYKEYLTEHRWIPIASFSTIILIASMGMLPLTYVILSEIIPKKIKNVVILMALETMWILAFILVSFYPTMTQNLGTYNCMFMFATCCILGGIFYLIALPETKGKSYEEIMQALAE